MDYRFESADVIINCAKYDKVWSTPLPKNNFDTNLNKFANAFKRNIVHAMTIAVSSKSKIKITIAFPDRIFFIDTFLLNAFSKLRYKFSISELNSYLEIKAEPRLKKKIKYIMKGKFEKYKDEK